ncbi:ParM/StbA family protein [Lactococcus lactis]|uniref:ParM/StbA family protein n=1 Tax=Lactococcus lactis TaxID=1358 RepID=UPI001652A21B|nr:ParM/StbA family protein [Lactococcus lactis]QNL91910.1 ParM/StbA family protein [Lactococcus lactis]
MTDKIYKLGIDIGNKLVKIVGDGQEQAMVYPASLARYEEVSYIFSNNIDYLEENGFEIFSLEKDNEESCYVWGKNIFKFGQAVIDTNGTGESRYDNQLYKKLVLFAIAKYVEELDEQELSDKVVLSLAMGMPDDEYISTAGQDFEVIKWLIGEHVVFIDNLPIEFEVKNIELLPQEFGSLVLFEKMEGGISPDVRTLIIDYGGMTRLRTVYDGFQQREINQDTMGVNRLIRLLVDKIKNKGINNNRRNNQINVQEMLISKNYKMKTGVSTEEDLTSLFKKEIKNYGKRRFEEEVYSGQAFSNIDLVILTGGGANLLEHTIYSQLGQEIWIPEQPETANVRGFYEYLKSHPLSNKSKNKREELQNGERSFNLGDKVRISEIAVAEENGYDLKSHRTWEGIVTEINNGKDDRRLYTIEYPSGDKNLYVNEKDLIKI